MLGPQCLFEGYSISTSLNYNRLLINPNLWNAKTRNPPHVRARDSFLVEPSGIEPLTLTLPELSAYLLNLACQMEKLKQKYTQQE